MCELKAGVVFGQVGTDSSKPPRSCRQEPHPWLFSLKYIGIFQCCG